MADSNGIENTGQSGEIGAIGVAWRHGRRDCACGLSDAPQYIRAELNAAYSAGYQYEIKTQAQEMDHG